MATAKSEWAASWPLPLMAMVGIMGGSSFSFSAGVLMGPITAEFGWSRAQFFSAITLQLDLAMFLVPIVGRLIDRVGSRRLAIFGTIGFACAFSLLATATGHLWQWWALNTLVVLFGSLIALPVWLRPVVMSFNISRGLAQAVALSGTSAASALWPVITAFLVASLGWRLTMPALISGWALVCLPLTLAFFFDHKGGQDEGRPQKHGVAKLPNDMPSVGPIARTMSFISLTLGGAMFSCAVFGLTLNFVPILQESGLNTQAAAGITSLIGIFAIVGRIGSGILLDRLSTGVVGCVVFILPAIACTFLWMGNGATIPMIAGGVLLGLGSGAQFNVITYIVATRFDARVFGSLYSVIISVVGFFASIGPLVAGAIYDRFGTYDNFLGLSIALTSCGALLVGRVALEPPFSATAENIAVGVAVRS